MSNKIIAIILAYNCQNEIIKTLKKIQKFEKYFLKFVLLTTIVEIKHLIELTTL